MIIMVCFRLRCESGAALVEVRVRVDEEREDKEARLEEEKVDYLRKMRLQVCVCVRGCV